MTVLAGKSSHGQQQVRRIPADDGLRDGRRDRLQLLLPRCPIVIARATAVLGFLLVKEGKNVNIPD